MELRDPTEVEPSPEVETRSRTSRRFARLVESPISRRVAMPRLVVAAGSALALMGLVAFGISRGLRSAASWVDARPEHQIPFDQIELVPEPDPWVRGGAALILEEVRKKTNFGDSISRLDVDLKALERDFSRSPWVKKVVRIDRTHHGRLLVELVYRKPVAVVPFPSIEPFAFVLDDEAVVLSDQEINWTIHNGPYQVRGMDGPLIMIRDLSADSPKPTVGLPWKRKLADGPEDEWDPMVLRAARIARFLMDRGRSPKIPEFASIHLPGGHDDRFFLRDSQQNCVLWGKAPGDERPGESSTEARWSMLLAWVKDHGKLDARGLTYLNLTGTKAELSTGKAIRKKQ